jgi:tetratricopeptide (TPR) repeat protein
MVVDGDLGWQLATGRWIIQHHQIPSTEVFSYTAQGQPWIYPVASELLLYAAFRLGGYAFLSYFGAAACVLTVAILVRRHSVLSAAIAILAVPAIAARTAPRAEMFSVLLFAIVLRVLWQHYCTGRAPLWLLPLLMAAWVNLHLGFIAGLAGIGGYMLVEALEIPWPGERRNAAQQRLLDAWPWVVASFVATLLNPWGWGIYRALARQNAAMAAHSLWVAEWSPVRMNWTILSTMSLRDPETGYLLLLVVTIVAVVSALFRRELGVATFLGAAAFVSSQHVRLHALYACVAVVVGGTLLTFALESLAKHIPDPRLSRVLAVTAIAALVLLAGMRSADIVCNRSYLQSPESFGAGRSWFFPERAADFIERANIPGELFNGYNLGGYLVWRLGPKRRDYIDGRAIPFGLELLKRENVLMRTSPDSPEWRKEAERYDINAALVSVARYEGLSSFHALPAFCASESWKPVYLDEVSAVFVRRAPETEDLIQHSRVDCATAPLPAITPAGKDFKAFNQWANAATVLFELRRYPEALDATEKATAIFPDSLEVLRGSLYLGAGNPGEAERCYRRATMQRSEAEAAWDGLARLYQSERRWQAASDAWEHSAAFSARPHRALLLLGYMDLEAERPADALRAFDRAAQSFQPISADGALDRRELASLAHERSLAYFALKDFTRAVSLEEEAVRLVPEDSEQWASLVELYERLGRSSDAQRAREQAAVH